VRIFIGLTDFAHIASTYAKAFRALGHETYTLVAQRNLFYPDEHYDLVLSDVIPAQQHSGWKRLLSLGKWKRVVVPQFIRALWTHDVFIFVFATSFFSSFLDYAILKLFKKQIVSVFLGDDVRYWYAFRERFRLLAGSEYSCPDNNEPYYGYRHNFYDTQLAKVKAAERYSDLILSQPDMDQLQSRPYMRVNTPLDLSEFRFSVPNRVVPIILHAPSDKEVKGTTHVLAAIEQLRLEGIRFEFRLIEKVSNVKLREMLADADIVIDQLWLTTIGTLAVESLASGNVVLASYHQEFSAIPAGCPVVNVTPWNLTEKLREVILNQPQRLALAYAGRPYVEKYHNHLLIGQQILDWLKPGGIQRYDFKPTFFQDEFVMPSELLQEERKKLRKLRPEGCWKRISQALRLESATTK